MTLYESLRTRWTAKQMRLCIRRDKALEAVGRAAIRMADTPPHDAFFRAVERLRVVNAQLKKHAKEQFLA